jgi:uncharacterized protein YdaU (DUF1376 family)
MGKTPAVQFYWADFIMDTQAWTCTQLGAYIRLLGYEWVNGSLPTEMAGLARIAGIDPRNMQKMWSAVIAKKFLTDEAGMYVNRRMEDEREKQRIYAELQKVSGKKGAEIRWGKDRVAHSNPNGENIALQSSSSSSSSSSKKKKDQKIIRKQSFSTPSLLEVKTYCQERGNSISPEKFLDYYEANGWMVGKNKMKNWQAAIRTWEQRDTGNNGHKSLTKPDGTFDMDAWEVEIRR